MGGHGGLNILPQKRWNVYNRDNREKVLQDEKAAKEKEDELRERHEQAEREYRRRRLLERAESGGAAGPSGHRSQEDGEGGGSQARGRKRGLSSYGEGNEDDEEEEVRRNKVRKNEEAEARQRDEMRRRGDPKKWTSDPKFDEKFGFGHGVGLQKEAAPWYARSQPPEGASAPGGGQQQDLSRKFLAEDRDDPARVMGLDMSSRKAQVKFFSDTAGGGASWMGTGGGGGGLKTAQQLRQERLERERAERDKMRRALLASNGIESTVTMPLYAQAPPQRGASGFAPVHKRHGQEGLGQGQGAPRQGSKGGGSGGGDNERRRWK